MNAESLATQLEQDGALTGPRLAEAFRSVPRHIFMPGMPAEAAYDDRALYNLTDDKGGFIGGSDRPSEMAKMLAAADIHPGHNILEIGTGTGYNAALLQYLVGDDGHVTSIEIDRSPCENAQDNLQRVSMGQINVVNADGAAGYSLRASYDRIISTVAVWDIPPVWIRQLRPNGIIVAPVFVDGLQVCAAFQLQDDGTLYSESNFTCAFVTMRGIEAPPQQYLYLGGGSALRLYANNARRIDSAALHMLMSMDAEKCHLGAAPSIRDYWDGFIPYMMLNIPQGYAFVSYTVEGGKNVYGLHGRGFGLIRSSSASFGSADDLGDFHCFAGVDAFLAIVSSYNDWVQTGSLRTDRMRVRLLPKSNDAGEAAPSQYGRLFERRNHLLHVWLQPLETGNATDEHYTPPAKPTG